MTDRPQTAPRSTTSAGTGRRIAYWTVLVLTTSSRRSRSSRVWANRQLLNTDNWTETSTEAAPEPGDP